MERLNVLREKLINEIGGVRSLGEDRERWMDRLSVLREMLAKEMGGKNSV